MIYATLITGFIFICIIIYNILFRSNSNNSNTNKPDTTINEYDVNNDKVSAKKFIKDFKKKERSIISKWHPRSMTETEKYLYSIKPNLQWWIVTHGSNILLRTVSELKGNKLFNNLYESNSL